MHPSKQLSMVEFALLQLIAENDGVSGYTINKLVEARGYRRWADIGETSIYVGLNKLLKKKLVEFCLQTGKQGKGPLPKQFSLTPQGRETLKAEALDALAHTRERERRFDLALAAAPFLDPPELARALAERKRFLESEREHIRQAFEKQGGAHLPAQVRLLFQHPLVQIAAELRFMDEAMQTFAIPEGTRHEDS